MTFERDIWPYLGQVRRSSWIEVHDTGRKCYFIGYGFTLRGETSQPWPEFETVNNLNNQLVRCYRCDLEWGRSSFYAFIYFDHFILCAMYRTVPSQQLWLYWYNTAQNFFILDDKDTRSVPMFNFVVRSFTHFLTILSSHNVNDEDKLFTVNRDVFWRLVNPLDTHSIGFTVVGHVVDPPQ